VIIEITEELLALIPKQLAYKYNIAPVSLKEGNLFVACTDSGERGWWLKT